MALTASLQLRQTQSLVMTPQMVQSIRLLQFGHVELAEFIEAEIEKNPLLEHGGEAGDHHADESETADFAPEANRPVDGEMAGALTTMAGDFGAALDGVFDRDVGGEPPTAAPPSGVSGEPRNNSRGGFDGGDFGVEDFATAEPTLHEHLQSQLPLAFRDRASALIGTEIIGSLDEDGYMRQPLGEIAVRLGADEAEVETALKSVQEFDPPGIAARDLAECLAIQLKARDRLDPAMVALIENLGLLARRDFVALSRICGVDGDDLAQMFAEIRALDPRPGERFGGGATQTVVADVLVTEAADGGWSVELNAQTLPRLLVNRNYFARIGNSLRKEEDRVFLSECLQNANWMIRGLDQRARTILSVASEIVKQQDMFLLRGIEFLRPLTLKAVADAVKLHESTVSRATSNKYMMTPRGLFELRSFFTTAIAASGGEEAHSAAAVRHRIRQMIGSEGPGDILSDETIVENLKQNGIEIARRTVAKYRETMHIPSSVQRRREKREIAVLNPG